MMLFACCLLVCVLGGRPPRPSFVVSAERAALRALRVSSSSSSSSVQELWFDQRLNHFGRDNAGRTWKQRFWVDPSFFDPSNPGPLFAQLGEEGEASSSMASGMAMASYGQEHGALLIAIEHRFYGKSQPLGDFSDLSLLSVDQALADYAAVIEHVSKLYNTTSNVVFGCSYIGSGAAWFRSKYSHLLSGAVASSPPVLAVADFFLYLDQVDQSIKEQFGDKCNTFIAAGYKQMVDLSFSSPSRVASDFNLCAAPQTQLDRATLAMSVMSTIMTVVQYDFEFGNNNIPYMCQAIMNSTAYQGLANFFTSQSGTCNDILFNDFIASLANVTYDPAQNMRQWTYQTCTEFGYFQTTTSPNQPFAYKNMVPLSYWNLMCQMAFNSQFDVEASVADTNSRYGGNQLPKFYATNIAYDYSRVDPWGNTLAPKHDVNPQSKVFIYETRGHCAAVSPPLPTDPQSIKDVRKAIAHEVNKWVVA